MPFVKGHKPLARKKKPVPRREKYGHWWDTTFSDLEIEMACYRKGGNWHGLKNRICGMGLAYHFKQIKSILWPNIVWHKWNELEMECFLKYRIMGVIGPASSGKSHSAATNFLADYFCWPECTTILVSSTTKESLEMRVWGEMKSYYRRAHNLFPWLPGNLIEGRQRIVTDDRSIASEGRDFRNGVVGVACKKGTSFQGLGEYVGIKNARVGLLADELSFMPKDFIHAIANLNKNLHFRCCGLGNPKEVQDALGYLCEPHMSLGGWDGGVDQKPGTKTWQIRFEQGICVQLPGSDSPNLDGKLGIPLICQRDIDADVAFWGKDSLQYTMMDEGRMPRGQGNRRVITRTLCIKFRALEEVIWQGAHQVKVGALDAAYRGVGGDRCIFGELRFGPDVEGNNIVALVETVLVPILDDIKADPEDQIADFVMQQCLMRGIPAEQFYFDSTGRGSLMSAFARKWSAYVNAVEFGGPGTDRPIPNGKKGPDGEIPTCADSYANFVTELWWFARLVIEAGQFRGMTEDMMQEGCAREWGFVGQDRGNNRIQVEPKPKMKLKTGRSPDLFDMLVCGLEGCRRLGFQVANLADFNQQDKRRDEGWKDQMRDQSQKLWHGSSLHYRG